MTNAFRHISVRETDGVLVLSIALQRVDTYELAEAMARELSDAVKDKQSPRVVVDLGKVVYMSSVGYGPLISLRGRVREADGRLILCGLSAVIQEMFEHTRLLINPQSPKSLFEFTDTLDKAIDLVHV